MCKIRIFLVLLVLCCGSCNSNHPLQTATDYDFLLGAWNSVSTESYEVWSQKEKGLLESKTYLNQNDSMIMVNVASLKYENNTWQYSMGGLDDKAVKTYKLRWDDKLNDYYFFDNTYPQCIYYKIKDAQYLNVYAGKNMAKEDYFEFLYEKVDKKELGLK